MDPANMRNVENKNQGGRNANRQRQHTIDVIAGGGDNGAGRPAIVLRGDGGAGRAENHVLEPVQTKRA